MKLVQKKLSILFAGLLSGFNLFPHHGNRISDKLGSLKSTYHIPYEDGFSCDAENLRNDWNAIKGDLMTSYNSAKDEPTA